MSLGPGTRLGPYEIHSAIGAGGMGEVYRATDTTLGRQVAIKVLPEAFAHDPERLARFEREAKTLAALNHPHIAQIYGLEKSSGVQALVMELVEGEDLSQRIARKAIPLDEALPIAKQIAEALEVAHEQGIIHRDLKPANIKVTPDGVVKVLDFGLAKLNDPNGPNSPNALSMSPTITSPAMMTGVGMILGTAAYMAPEQAKGRPADKRSDIWAFGCVLYEMLTGRRAFEGDSVADVLAGVIKGEPDWTAVPPSTPPMVERMLRRCLRKDYRERLHDIGDARIEIEDVDPEPKSRNTSASSVRGAWVVVGALVLAVFGFVGIRAFRPLATTPIVQFQVAPPRGGILPGAQNAPRMAMSPDGRYLAFAVRIVDDGGVERLWLRRLDQLEATPVPGSESPPSAAEPVQGPFWSPDSRYLAFFGDDKLKRFDLVGGSIQTLATMPGNNYGGTWNKDGIILFGSVRTKGIQQLPAGGGVAVPVTTMETTRREQAHLWPQFLPDGRHFLYFSVTDTPSENGVFLGELGSTERRRILQSENMAYFAPPGFLLFVREGALVAQPFDPGSFELRGVPVTIAERVQTAGNGRIAVAFSETGLLAYRPAGNNVQGTPVWVDRVGKEGGALTQAPLSAVLGMRVSPDGGRVALITNRDMWVHDVSGRPPIRVTSSGDQNAPPVWSPDGQRLIIETQAGTLASVPADGSGTPAPSSPAGHFHPFGWSPDGREVLAMRQPSANRATGTDIVKFAPRPDVREEPVVETPYIDGGQGAALSPNGLWLAYSSNQTGQQEIWVRPFQGSSAAIRVSPNGGRQPAWSRDGHELFYLEGQKIMAVRIAGGSELRTDPPAILFESRYYHDLLPPSYDVAPNGNFLMVKASQTAVPDLVVIQNWMDLVRRLGTN